MLIDEVADLLGGLFASDADGALARALIAAADELDSRT
jgi:hypothetical protein